jgi:hypothetical protein
MSKPSKLLIAVGVVAAVVLMGILLLPHNGKGPEIAAEAPLSETAPVAQTDQPSVFTKRVRSQPAQTEDSAQPTGMVNATTNAIPVWEARIDEILGSTSPDLDKAKQLLTMFPTLPADAQEDVARHISNLLPDEEFGLLRPYLTNSALPENVLDALLGDVLNRPNSLKLPALLDIAQNADRPAAAEAKDFLELLLDEDYGTDWAKWQAGTEQWLKANPD